MRCRKRGSWRCCEENNGRQQVDKSTEVGWVKKDTCKCGGPMHAVLNPAQSGLQETLFIHQPSIKSDRCISVCIVFAFEKHNL